MDGEYKYIVKGKLGLLIWGAKFRDKKQAATIASRCRASREARCAAGWKTTSDTL